ncbi:HAD family hydrolase [Bacillus marasmi]|uniref:HAD family hydrolase n=1 Tax=Bacillus marasmi TaxID=1926279 RepID=UPI0011C6FE42|nr:HAD family hydrolase [Bacillus marasmi]
MIKCIASDMDGTLLTGSGSISEGNKQAIQLAQAKGIEFIVATGRSYQEAQYALKQVGIVCPVISVNGAVVVGNDGKMITSQQLSKEDATAIAAILANDDIYFEVYTNDGTYTNNLEKAISVMVDVFTSANHHISKEQVEAFAKGRISEGFVHSVENFEEIFKDESKEVYKLLAFSSKLEKLKEARSALAAFTNIAVSSSGDGNLEITSVQAQKGIALQKFVSSKGISLIETMAIGDNDNDLSMLKLVGKAVAMGNAPAHIKAQAHYVTETNELDGVAKAIQAVLES